jgi:CPA1 family monovalent cation:H+ antiporter
MLIDVILISGLLLTVIAFVEAIGLRWAISESVLLAALGFTLGGAWLACRALLPNAVSALIAPVVAPRIPAEAFLWMFLPTLLFQAALSVNVRKLLADVAPIMLLAVVAVFVTTGLTGVAVAMTGFRPLVDGLLIGAMIATTDPSAVPAVFREVGAPARLVRLVEGESLLNDAAAIAIVGVLITALVGNAAGATPALALRELAVSFCGGVLAGALAGRAVAWMLPRLGGKGKAEVSLTLALPYPLYLFADQTLHLSGVVAVVTAGLVISGLGRTRLSPRNWDHLQLILEQAAAIAGAAVFLLAAIRVPHTLEQATWQGSVALLVVVASALAARLIVVFGMLPVLSRLRLSQPISTAYKLVIAWGGLRGAVTLVLAMGLSENTALPESTRRFVSIVATGFVLVSLLVNGTSLKFLIRRLKLDLLSNEDQALQQQVVRLSAISVEHQVQLAARAFHIAPEIATGANDAYRRSIELGTTPFDIEAALQEPDRLGIGQVTLATRERDLIPQYGNGIISIHNLDAMMRNTEAMIDAARHEGRVGYRRAARRILEYPLSFRMAAFAHDHLHLEQPLADAIADRRSLRVDDVPSCRTSSLAGLREGESDATSRSTAGRVARCGPAGPHRLSRQSAHGHPEPLCRERTGTRTPVAAALRVACGTQYDRRHVRRAVHFKGNIRLAQSRVRFVVEACRQAATTEIGVWHRIEGSRFSRRLPLIGIGNTICNLRHRWFLNEPAQAG